MHPTKTRTRTHAGRPQRATSTFSQELVLVVPEEAEIVEAELLEGQPPDISTNRALMKAALDALFSEDGSRLVPPPLTAVSPLHETGPVTEQQKRKATLLAMVNQLVQDHAQSKTTGASYGSHLRAWRSWCTETDQPELPFDPQRVMEFIVHYAFERDEHGEAVRDDEGDLVPVVSAGTVSQRLAALNKAAEYLGLPQPGQNPGVRLMMTGLRRLIGVGRRHEKDALDLSLVERCIAVTSGATFLDARSRAAVLLRARTGASTGQLQRLRWTDLRAERGEEDLWRGPATGLKVTLAPTHRYGKPRTITVRPHRNPDLCLVEALRSLRQLSQNLSDEVFTHPRGKASRAGKTLASQPLTRQALHLLVLQAVGDASWDDLPQMNDRALATVLAAHSPVDPLIQVRNTALLLTGFYTALRRSNLASLRWRDLDDRGTDAKRGGVTVSVYRTKTDPEGTRKIKWLPQLPPSTSKTCPATAMRAWQSALATALGRMPHPDEPVFVSLHRSGSVKRNQSGALQGISGQDICDIVQQLTVAAGLDEEPPAKNRKDAASTGIETTMSNRRKPQHRRKYGAHSLRIGFVTECFTDNKIPVADVQAVTDHKSVGVLMDYYRRVNDAENNPARTLANLLASKESAPIAEG